MTSTMHMRIYIVLLLAIGIHAVDFTPAPSVDGQNHARRLKSGCLQGDCNTANTDGSGSKDREHTSLHLEKGHTFSAAPVKTVVVDNVCICYWSCHNNRECRTFVFDHSDNQCYHFHENSGSMKLKECSECLRVQPGGHIFVETCWRESSMEPTYSTKHKKVRTGEHGEYMSEASVEESKKIGASKMASAESIKHSLGGIGKYGKGTAAGDVGTSFEKCTISEGYDQPEEYNMLSKPLLLVDSFACCDACSQNPTCKSWVWKGTSIECYLKNQYDASRNTIVCDTCIAYSASSKIYVYEAASVKEEEYVETGYKEKVEYGMTLYEVGKGAVYDKASGDEKCRFMVGKDQPKRFNIQKNPFQSQNAYQCCSACNDNSQCVAWVWNSATKVCALKKNYDASQSTDCATCVVSSADGTYYLHPGSGSGSATHGQTPTPAPAPATHGSGEGAKECGTEVDTDTSWSYETKPFTKVHTDADQICTMTVTCRKAT